MLLVLATEAVPLETGKDGVIRIRGSRVTLDTLAGAYLDGATPDEIAQQYPTLSLSDIYNVIRYYLRHSNDLDQYFQQRRHAMDAVRQANEARWPPFGIRERLLARQKKD